MLTLDSLTMVYLELNQAFMDLENAKKNLNDAFEQNSKETKVLEEKIKNSFETIQDLRSQDLFCVGLSIICNGVRNRIYSVDTFDDSEKQFLPNLTISKFAKIFLTL
jgi:hypothetical protein